MGRWLWVIRFLGLERVESGESRQRQTTEAGYKLMTNNQQQLIHRFLNFIHPILTEL